jgi:hypothetical protein
MNQDDHGDWKTVEYFITEKFGKSLEMLTLKK